MATAWFSWIRVDHTSGNSRKCQVQHELCSTLMDTVSCARLRTRRSAGLFKHWDSLKAALEPLLLLDCGEACPIEWDAMHGLPAPPEPSAPGGANSSSAAGGGAGSAPQGCRLLMPSQAELLAAEDGGLLLKAVNEHGGLVEVAGRLGVTMRSKG